MHPLAKKLLLIRQMEIEEKCFRIMGKNVGIFPIASIFINDEILRKNYEFGKAIGKEIIDLLEKFYPQKNEKMLEFSFNLVSLFGFGKAKIFNREKKVLIEVEDSPLAQEAVKKGYRGKKACSLIAGIFAGIYSSIFEKVYEVQEVSCKAEGNPKCIFEVFEKE